MMLSKQCSRRVVEQARTCNTVVPVVRSLISKRLSVVVSATFAPPPVAATKANFLTHYKKPIVAIYNQVIQELLVQQHFVRYSVNYQYNEVFALGVMAVFDQILETLPSEEKNAIVDAYILSLGEDPAAYRRDAATLEKAASQVSGGMKLVPSNAEGSLEIQKTLAKIAESSLSGKMSYNKFFAIGLFRMLELTGAKEPSALEALVEGMGVRRDLVNKDLTLYKGVLSKLSVAKELLKDFMEREKKKQAEREAEKAAKAAKAAAASA